MKKLTATLAALALGATLTACSAPAPLADGEKFSQVVQAAGLGHAERELRQVGETTCEILDEGYSMDFVILGIIQGTETEEERDLASFVVAASVLYLCPQHEEQLPS